MDLFVNNERTLLKIYEALFPHRAAPTQQNSQMQQPMSMMENSFNNSMHLMGPSGGGRMDQRSAGGTRILSNAFPSHGNQSLNTSYNGPLG